MVEYSYVDECQCFFKLLSDDSVRTAWLAVSAGMVVAEDHSGCVVVDAPAHDFARVDLGIGNAASKEFLEGDDAVAVVEEQAAKNFVGIAGECYPKESSGGSGVFKWLSDALQPSQQDVFSDFEEFFFGLLAAKGVLAGFVSCDAHALLP